MYAQPGRKVNIPKWQPAGLRLISLQNAKSYTESMVIMTYKAFRERLPIPQKFFPFADDGGGIYISLTTGKVQMNLQSFLYIMNVL